MPRFGAGLAVAADVVSAAERATDQALEGIDGRRPALMVAFVSGAEPGPAADALLRATGRAMPVAAIGGTTPGVIADGRGVEQASAVAVWCGVLPDVRARTFALEVLPSKEGMAVMGMPEQAADDGVAVLIADPWSFPVDGFVERSNLALPGLPIVGGIAAGVTGRGSTRLLVDDRVVERGAVGVVLGGPVGARTLVSQGCRPVGPAMTVTAAEGNVILELAGVPALRKLQEVLANLPPEDQALASAGLQIGIARDEYAEEHTQGDFLIRGVGGVDEARGGLVVGDLVTVGRTVRFQVRDAAAADADLRDSIGLFRSALSPATVEGALVFSCNGRGAHLFGTADHDPSVVHSDLVGQGVAGCFAAGEIGPVAGLNFVHGFTASILAFGSTAVAPQ